MVSTPSETGVCASPGRLHFPGLAATVHVGQVPDGLADELPGLYNSLYSTLDWFVTQGGRPPNGACVLEEPRHVLLFDHHGGNVDILNRAFACTPDDAGRVCRALFRAFPAVHIIHLEVMFPPGQLAFPRTTVERVSRMVIDLPGSVDEYHHSLSKSTRRHLRVNRNRLRRTFPDMRTETFTPGDDTRALVDRLVEWKIQRFHEDDRLTYWEANPKLAEHTAALVRRCGQCRITHIGDEEATIHLCFRVGDTMFPLEGAHDPKYDAYGLGFLALYEAVCAAIESGARSANLSEGTVDFKERLGAHPVLSTRLAVYPSQLVRLRSVGESLKIVRGRSRAAYYELGRRMRRYPMGDAMVRFARRVRLARWNRTHSS